MFFSSAEVRHSTKGLINGTVTARRSSTIRRPHNPQTELAPFALGVYKKTAPLTYKSKHPFWSFDATGTLVGTGVILETLILDRSGNHYTGSFEWITYDLKGNVTSDTKGELKAERITVD